MMYSIFTNITDAQALIDQVNAIEGFPKGDTLTWASPMALAVPAGSYVVPIDPVQLSDPREASIVAAAVPFPTDGSWAWPVSTI